MSQADVQNPKIEDSVRWRWAGRNWRSKRFTGIVIDTDGDRALVRFDDGSKDWCDATDLIIQEEYV